MLGACVGEEGADYCKNHYRFHADHLGSIATLDIVISGNGDLRGHLTVPRTVVGDMPDVDLRRLLADPERSFVLESESFCTLSLVEISDAADSYDVTYAAACGPGNRLEKINVALFDYLTDLEEVVVAVTTPATAKNFGISRQCDNPVFRLIKG